MENYDISNCSVNDSYVVSYKDKKFIKGKETEVSEYHTISGENLLLTFEGDLNAIAYTNAVDKHIDRSIRLDSYRKGYNDFIKDFESGKYDSDEELDKVYTSAIKLFHNKDIVFVLVDGTIMQLDSNNDIVNEICTIFRNSLDYIDINRFKYLNGFVNYMGKPLELKK